MNEHEMDKVARQQIEGQDHDATVTPHGQPLVIIESPFAGDIAANKDYARACLLDCLQRGEAPIASHLLHTQVLDDMEPDERHLGIEAGLAWYRVADKCVVYTDRGMSAGMAKGVTRAKQYGVTVEYRTLDNADKVPDRDQSLIGRLKSLAKLNLAAAKKVEAEFRSSYSRIRRNEMSA